MSLPAIRIILVDDHPYVIESWKELFDHDDRFQVISQFDDSWRLSSKSPSSGQMLCSLT